jgi:hypothetical protein
MTFKRRIYCAVFIFLCTAEGYEANIYALHSPRCVTLEASLPNSQYITNYPPPVYGIKIGQVSIRIFHVINCVFSDVYDTQDVTRNLFGPSFG